MSDQNDESQGYALMVLAGVVALVVAGVLGLAISRGLHRNAVPTETAAKAATSTAVMARIAGEPEGRIYFEVGSDALPAGASDVLASVADSARAQAGRVVLISGFHDASGDAGRNVELAKKRALAVRHALEANGVAPDRLVMDKPAVATGGVDARAARRVEVRLR